LFNLSHHDVAGPDPGLASITMTAASPGPKKAVPVRMDGIAPVRTDAGAGTDAFTTE